MRQLVAMIPLARIREILGPDSHYTTEDLERVRDDLYAVAKALKAVARERRESERESPNARAAAFSQLSTDELTDVEERAAIAEFDGNLAKDEAERFAFQRHRGTPRGGVN